MFHATILDKISPYLKKANYIVSCILLIILFFVLMVHLNKEIRDLDLWLHLKTGEQIFLNRAIPLIDTFSFSKENSTWINHEWLFQLLSYIFFSNVGFDGLIFMQNIVFISVFLILFLMGFKNRNFIFVTVMLYIFLLNSSYRFTIRPDMFSVLFLVLFLFILKENKFLYLLPIFQILWTNFHGFFFIGPLVIFIFYLTQRQNKQLIILLLSLLACLVNPQFIKGAIYPLTTSLSLIKDKIVLDIVQELRRPFAIKTFFDFRDLPFFKALIIVSIFGFRFNQKKFNFTLFLLWFVFLIFSLLAIRNIIYFAIVAIVTIFYNASQRFSYDNNFSNEKFVNNKFYFLGRYFLIFIFSLSMIKNAILNIGCYYYDFNNYNFKSCLWGVSQKNFPKKVVDFILKENLPKRLFNDFNSGSYLIGRTYPQRKVFIDGRTEFYGNNFLKEYKEVTNGDEKTIEKIIKQFDLQGFLLTMAMNNYDEKLAKYLFNKPEWKPVYFDETALIFLKDSPFNKNLIEKFYIDLKTWSAPKAELARISTKIIYPYTYIKRAKILIELGCFNAVISEAKEALKIMPNCAEAFELLGSSYLELKEYNLALENLRLAVSLAPGEFVWRNKFALILYKTGYLKEAESQLLQIIKSRPRDPENYYNLALVYKRMDNLKKAEVMIKNASKFSKNKNFDYLKLSAEVLFELKKYKEALSFYKSAQTLQPQNLQIQNSIDNIEKLL